MTRPDDISQAIWDAATAIEVMDESVCDWEYNLHIDIARALSDAYSRGLEDAARVAERDLGINAAAIRALGSK